MKNDRGFGWEGGMGKLEQNIFVLFIISSFHSIHSPSIVSNVFFGRSSIHFAIEIVRQNSKTKNKGGKMSPLKIHYLNLILN